MNKDAYVPPSKVTVSEIDGFVERLGTHLNGLIPSDFETFGELVNSIVDGLVPPKARDFYRSPGMVIGLAILEIGNIGQKIHRYQFIERYKFFADMPDAEMGLAFAEHMYAVRNAELYSILERGEAVVRFVAAIAVELQTGDSKAANKYTKEYRRQFEYRLRERHRMTHAHERPSLVSRMLQLSDVKTDEERQMIQSIFGDILNTMVSAFELIQERQPEGEHPTHMSDPVAFQKWYLQRVDGEAASMWHIFTESVLVAAGLFGENLTVATNDGLAPES